jgi:hypothetical protein
VKGVGRTTLLAEANPKLVASPSQSSPDKFNRGNTGGPQIDSPTKGLQVIFFGKACPEGCADSIMIKKLAFD